MPHVSSSWAASSYLKSGNMSRLAKKPIAIPKGVTVTASNGRVTVKGPKGELSREFRPIIGIEVGADTLVLTPKSSSKETRALWGTYASHIKNMIAGVSTPFEKKLIIDGIGFKADVRGKDIVLGLGFSHPVTLPIPEGIEAKSEKGLITISGINKELVGSFSAAIRDLKRPEPYKGKGIRYADEYVRRKAGKAGKK